MTGGGWCCEEGGFKFGATSDGDGIWVEVGVADCVCDSGGGVEVGGFGCWCSCMAPSPGVTGVVSPLSRCGSISTCTVWTLPGRSMSGMGTLGGGRWSPKPVPTPSSSGSPSMGGGMWGCSPSATVCTIGAGGWSGVGGQDWLGYLPHIPLPNASSIP